MRFNFNPVCPHCGVVSQYEAGESNIGQEFRCLGCNRIFLIVRPDNRISSSSVSDRKQITSPTLIKPIKTTSSGWVLSVVFLTLVCIGLAVAMFYLIKVKNDNSLTGQGTPVAPTKENIRLARQNAEKETIVKKMMPDVTVDGEVFIVTKGGQSIKLGLVEIALIPMQTLQPHLENRQAARLNQLAGLESQIKIGREDLDRLKRELNTAFNEWSRELSAAIMKDLNADTSRSHLTQKYHNANKVAGAASYNYWKLLKQQTELLSGSFYFQSIPTPLRMTKTNSDGRFQLLVPSTGLFAIAATTSRVVGDEEERYYWIIKIDPKAGMNQTIMLSNDNLATPSYVKSLIEAP